MTILKKTKPEDRNSAHGFVTQLLALAHHSCRGDSDGGGRMIGQPKLQNCLQNLRKYKNYDQQSK